MHKITNQLNFYFLRRFLELNSANQKQELPMVAIFFADQNKMRSFCKGPHKHHSWKVCCQSALQFQRSCDQNVKIFVAAIDYLFVPTQHLILLQWQSKHHCPVLYNSSILLFFLQEIFAAGHLSNKSINQSINQSPFMQQFFKY